MELQALFPRWRQSSTDPCIPWTHDVDLSDGTRFGAVLVMIAVEQNAAMYRPDYFLLCEAMVRDVVSLLAALPNGREPVNLQFLQFEVALGPFKNAMATGDFGLAHDWIHNGLSNEIGHAIARTIEPDRMTRFAQSRIAWIRDNRADAIADWAADFYYYCRVRGTMFEVADALAAPVLVGISTLSPRDAKTINSLGMMLNWATTYQHVLAGSLTAKLLPLFNERESLPIRTRIATMFATAAGELSGHPPRHWAAWALAHGAAFLNVHERFQLVWHQIDSVDDWDRLRPQILAAIGDYATGLGQPTAIVRATDQRSGLLKPAFVLMQKFARSDDLLEILATWYGVPDQIRLRCGALFVCSTFEHGTIYLGAARQLIERDGDAQIADLTKAENAMFGGTLTIEGSRDEPLLPERPGHPLEREAPAFATAVHHAYAFAEIRPEVMVGRRALISIPGQRHPLQALMVAARGTSLPISASLEIPQADRQVCKALLWAAGNDFYSEIEIGAVEAVLVAAGVEVVRRIGHGATPVDFVGAYADPTFDLVLVAGHGEIDRWHDGSACVIAGEECKLGIDALRAASPDAVGRRLSVFNICDGGVSAQNGGIQKLGLAPMLAHSRQATIAHLWPVNPLMASAFGVLLAHALAKGAGFHGAFDTALTAIHAPLAEITAAVRAIVPNHELVKRLSNLDLDTGLILHWGSPCFFQ